VQRMSQADSTVELSARPPSFTLTDAAPREDVRAISEILGSPHERYSSWRRTVGQLQHITRVRERVKGGDLDRPRLSLDWIYCLPGEEVLQQPAPGTTACGRENDTGNGFCGPAPALAYRSDLLPVRPSAD
jgi:hypothetical protein